MQRKRGFTLIEILIVVAILGLLTTIAYPSYVDYIDRGKAVEAATTLADMRVRMEQYFQDNRTYVGAPICAAPTPTKYFSYACTGIAANTFLVTASSLSPVGAFQYTVDQANTRRTVNFKGVAVGLNCWITKKGETC